MESFRSDAKQSVVGRSAFGEIPAGDPLPPDLRYGRFGSFEGLCNALLALLDTMTSEEARLFVDTLEVMSGRA
jgi:hypothetical protein